MMQGEEVLKIFEQTGAYLRGHFRLTSGLHSPEYLQCALVLQHPAHAEQLGRALAARLGEIAAAGDVKVVASPAIGGLIIGHEVARALGVRALFAERRDGVFTLRRGFAIAPGERIAVVEDVFTTGGSTREVCEAVAAEGGEVVAVGSLVDRGVRGDAFPVPARSVLSLSVPSWPPERCPLCEQGVPLDAPGSRFASAL